MYLYEASLSIQGSISRWPMPPADRTLERTRALDSLILSRLHGLPHRPSLLLFASTDAQRPSVASLFSRATILNSTFDIWNAIFKAPYGHACFAQIVDQIPGQYEASRLALEQSLIKVKPYDMQSFEHLLERLERVAQPHESEALLQDNIGRLLSVGPINKKRSWSRESSRCLTCVEAYIESDSVDHGRGEFCLVGRDFPVTDFRENLQGMSDFFQRWNTWIHEVGLSPSGIDRIYIYSQIRNLLPACWDELRSRGVSADQIRLPQWSGLANALSSFMEFLLSDTGRSIYIYFPMNGRCHVAYLVRNT